MRTPRRKSVWVGIVAGVLLVGCQSIRQPQAPEPVYAVGISISDWVGPEGGTLRAGNYTLTVPPGALGEPTEITLEQLAKGEWPVELSPDGLQFTIPAMLSMNASGEPNPGSLQILWWDPSAQHWVTQLSSHLNGSVSTLLNHFSRYTLG